MSFAGLDLWPLTAWLLTFAVHGTAVLGVAWLLARLLGHRALALQEHLLRHALWVAVASASLQCSGLLPEWPAAQLSPQLLVAAPPVAGLVDELPESSLAALDGGSSPAAPVLPPWPVLATLAAVLAAAMGVLWLWRTHRRLLAVLRDRRPETDGRVLATAAAVAGELGLRQSPAISRSPRLAAPIAFGWLRPEICLPDRAAQLADGSLRAMLAHELAHLRRGDPAWTWLACGVQALFPWQPLLWLVRRRWHQLVELRCDAVAAAHTSPTAVARCLLDVAEWLRPAPSLHTALGMARHRSSLHERVQAALRGERHGVVPAAWSAFGSSAIVSLLTFAAPAVRSEPGPAVVDSLGMTAPAPADAPAAATDAALDFTVALHELQRDHDTLTTAAQQLEAELRRTPHSPELDEQLAVLRHRLFRLASLRARLHDALGARISPAAK